MQSIKTDIEMAKIFLETGEWFMKLPEEFEVDMSLGQSKVLNTTGGFKCNSPACFGGWLAIKYEKIIGGHRGLYVDYNDGLYAFAQHLGFSQDEDLELWAYDNDKIWGNPFGVKMFIQPYAFDEGDKKYDHTNITTKAIGKKLIAVADRLMKESVDLKDFEYKKEKRVAGEGDKWHTLETIKN